MVEAQLTALRDVIQEDPGGRGLRTDPDRNLITACAGDFAAACRSIADTPEPRVAVVTGFFIPTAEPPTAETDGPLGALFLARALAPLGQVVRVTDDFCQRALSTGLATCGLRKQVPLVTLPTVQEALAMPAADYWQHFAERAGPLTHLIALERCGPSHTPESIEAQDPAALEAFIRAVPAREYNRCHTMRGRDITLRMSPAHQLFEAAPGHGIVTIGIGDGGNEIGMGKIPWTVLERNVPNAAVTACRVATEHLIVCGVSNWGAYGLAAGVRLLRGRPLEPAFFDPQTEEDLLRVMVQAGPLVDGVLGQAMISVDGLTWEKYTEPLRKLGTIA
jgi:hypothetical protein